jgi:hypothetical protein
MFKRLTAAMILTGSVTVLGGFAASAASSTGPPPSGQRMYGNTTFSSAAGHFTGGGGAIEPAYDDTTGGVVYIQTPNRSQAHPNAHNVAPLYLPVYPAGSGIDPSTLDCTHVPADNCPDHGPAVAGAAATIDPGVYSDLAGHNLVVGHDHLLGIASSGGDFNVLWEPTLVLFTSVAAASQHITTLAQINAAVGAGEAFLVPLPQLDFHCSVVSAAAYQRATPAPTVVGP